MDTLANGGYSTVLTAPSPATTGTTLTVQTGDGAKFPAAPFDISLYTVGVLPIFTYPNANAEIARVTALPQATLNSALTSGVSSGTTLTVTALSAAMSTGQNITVVSGSHTQTFVLTANAALSATSVSVTAQTANYSYPVGSVVSGDVMTITRAQYNTTAQTVTAGWAVNNAVTANLLNQIFQVPFTLDNGTAPVVYIDIESGVTTTRFQPTTPLTSSGDGAIITLMSAALGTANTSFTDWKLSNDGVAPWVIHLLGDRTGTNAAPSVMTIELDPRNQSTTGEFQVITGSFRGGSGTVLIDIVQGTGITDIANGTLSANSKNLVLASSGQDVVLHPTNTTRSWTDGASDIGTISYGPFRFNNGRFLAAVTVGAGGLFDTDGQAAGAVKLGTTNANQVILGSSTALVDFNYATTAVGGGSTATNGTIGGSGPATAAQNSWLKIQINGTTSYIPVWR